MDQQTEIIYNLPSNIELIALFERIKSIAVIGLSPKPDRLALLFFSAILIISRGPIAYIAATLFVYFWIQFRDERFSPQTIA